MLTPQDRSSVFTINQQISNPSGYGKFLPLIADTLEELHFFAINELGLSPDDFEPEYAGYPCYRLPMHKAGCAGMRPLTSFGIETESKCNALITELKAHPDRGYAFAKSVRYRYEGILESR